VFLLLLLVLVPVSEIIPTSAFPVVLTKIVLLAQVLINARTVPLALDLKMVLAHNSSVDASAVNTCPMEHVRTVVKTVRYVLLANVQLALKVSLLILIIPLADAQPANILILTMYARAVLPTVRYVLQLINVPTVLLVSF